MVLIAIKLSRFIPVLLILLTISSFSNAQMPSTDIWLFDLNIDNSKALLSNPVNITSSPGYDNQPYFSKDGKTLLFSREIGGQTDIMEHDIASGKNKRVTETTTSEYSPQYRNKDLVVLMVEKDSSQRVWKNPGTAKAKRITEIKGEQIGYYLFLDNSHVMTFILGEPHKLKLFDLGTGKGKFISDSIGRCMRIVPGQNVMSFTRILGNKAYLYFYDIKSGHITKVKSLPSEDYEWVDKKTLISSDGTDLKISTADPDKEWQRIQVTERIALPGITRVAYSPATKKVALVAKEE